MRVLLNMLMDFLFPQIVSNCLISWPPSPGLHCTELVDVWYEIFTALLMKITIYWEVASCWLLSTQRDFGEAYYLHLQDNHKDTYCDFEKESSQIPRIAVVTHSCWRANNSPAPLPISCNPFMKLLLAVIPHVTIHRPSGIHKPPRFVCYPFM